MASTSTTILRRKALFTDTNQSRLKYVRAFQEDHGVRFVDVRVTEAVKDRKFSNVLAVGSKAI